MFTWIKASYEHVPVYVITSSLHLPQHTNWETKDSIVCHNQTSSACIVQNEHWNLSEGLMIKFIGKSITRMNTMKKEQQRTDDFQAHPTGSPFWFFVYERPSLWIMNVCDAVCSDWRRCKYFMKRYTEAIALPVCAEIGSKNRFCPFYVHHISTLYQSITHVWPKQHRVNRSFLRVDSSELIGKAFANHRVKQHEATTS